MKLRDRIAEKVKEIINARVSASIYLGLINSNLIQIIAYAIADWIILCIPKKTITCYDDGFRKKVLKKLKGK